MSERKESAVPNGCPISLNVEDLHPDEAALALRSVDLDLLASVRGYATRDPALVALVLKRWMAQR